MKILIWTNDNVNATRARLSMIPYRMDLLIHNGPNPPPKEIFQNSDDLSLVMILDRLSPHIDLQSALPERAQVFVIVSHWSDLKDYERLSDERVCRFYLWPFNWDVIIDDIRAVALAERYLTRGIIEAGGLLVDVNAHTVSDGKETVALRKKEYELLTTLMKNKGRVLSRNMLLEIVWDFDARIKTNTVDVHVSRLRKILRMHFGLKEAIKTIPCAGYLFS